MGFRFFQETSAFATYMAKGKGPRVESKDIYDVGYKGTYPKFIWILQKI